VTVHFFHGDKGGSGKSFAAMAFVDWLVERRKSAPLVVDADMRNPDAHRMFEAATRTALVNLREHDGWIELASLLDEAAESEIVVSLPGNIGDVLDTELPPFIEATKPLGVTIVLWWVINRTPDSVNLLRPARAVFGDGRSVVVRNLFFGDEPRFRRWNESKTRTEFLNAGGLEIDLPDLHERLADQTAMGLPAVRFSQLEGMRFGDRAEMRRWLDVVDRGFSQVADTIGVK
jgi:hypothetical protein